ncbi:hypothetical protein RUM44_010008 [Polyplax serrata]|uniref:Uncharacterized protein n=1 Tax=Polyplax serrata TaxID=468196 RepID=A0ABR1AUD0_POLSC
MVALYHLITQLPGLTDDALLPKGQHRSTVRKNKANICNAFFERSLESAFAPGDTDGRAQTSGGSQAHKEKGKQPGVWGQCAVDARSKQEQQQQQQRGPESRKSR